MEDHHRIVEAAGCVVWRRGPSGVEVLLVHRPAPHDDWSLPKGKLHRDESHEEAARREVHEETAVRGRLGAFLGEVRYDLPDGRHKHVRYWAMEAESDDGWTPGDEIDDRRWVPLDDIAGELDWHSDRVIVEAFVDQLGDHADPDAL